MGPVCKDDCMHVCGEGRDIRLKGRDIGWKEKLGLQFGLSSLSPPQAQEMNSVKLCRSIVSNPVVWL